MGKDREKHKIIVVGLPTQSTNEDLIKLVKPFGNPLEAGLAIDADGRNRGFGFVRFADEETQKDAIASLDKTDFYGRTLNVRAVEERSQKDGPRAAGGGRKDSRPCFDFARGRCTRGAACKWAHVLAAGSETSRRPDWQKPRATGIDSAAEVLTDIPDDYCRKYQLGKCPRGGETTPPPLVFAHRISRASRDILSSLLDPTFSNPTPHSSHSIPTPHSHTQFFCTGACRWKHLIWKTPAGLRKEGGGANEDEGGGDGSSEDEITDQDINPTLPNGRREQMVGEKRRRLSAENGGQENGAARIEAITEMLQRREREWRVKSGEEGGVVPAAVKNRDVVWRAMERMLERSTSKV